jgi:hypothetical protein
MFNDVALVERAGVSDVSLLVAATTALQTPVLLPGGQMPRGKVAVASCTVELVMKKGCGHSWDIIGCRERTSTFGRHTKYSAASSGPICERDCRRLGDPSAAKPWRLKEDAAVGRICY